MISRIIQTEVNVICQKEAEYSLQLTEILLILINVKPFPAFANLSLSNGIFKFFSFKYVVKRFKPSFIAFLGFSTSFLLNTFRLSFLETVSNLAIISIFQNRLLMASIKVETIIGRYDVITDIENYL